MAEAKDKAGRARMTVPNAVTVARMLMSAAAVACFALGAWGAGVTLCVAAALLDAFDGWYARGFAQCSSLGEHLDPLADKLLMAVVYGVIAVGMHAVLVWALVGLIALREAGMTAFRSYSLRRHGRFIPANALGKVKMVAQSVVGLGVLTYAYAHGGRFDFPPGPVVLSLTAILALSYVSAFVYVMRWRAAPALDGGAESTPFVSSEGDVGEERMVARG